MHVLVLNAGSSTLKFQLVRTDEARVAANTDEKLARGTIERIGGEAIVSVTIGAGDATRGTAPLRDLRAAVEYAIGRLVSAGAGVASVGEIEAVGHRVVHGGERFQRSTRVDDAVLKEIEATIDLAPLHNPANLRGIAAARAVLGPGVPQVAVFDTRSTTRCRSTRTCTRCPTSSTDATACAATAFTALAPVRGPPLPPAHRTARDATRWSPSTWATAAPRARSRAAGRWTRRWASRRSRGSYGDALRRRRPAILDYVADKEGLTLQEVENLLNKQSGLLGVSGLTNDMRELLAEAEEFGDRRARLAIEIFCYRARKYVGAYLAAMGGADAVVFAGGVGENAAVVRARICAGLEWAGLTVDPARNAATVGGREGRISADGAALEAWVIPTDEELLIARDTMRAVEGLEARY
jgi:acetate kinase